MSVEDEMAARGQMMTEYRENEARIATLRDAAAAVGQHWERLGNALKGIQLDGLRVTDAEVVIDLLLVLRSAADKAIPRTAFDLDAVARLTVELRELTSRQGELHRRLVQIGFLPA